MKLIALISSYIVLCLRLLSRGGVRAVAAENMVLRQQLITLSRNQKRATRLTFFEKITFGLFASMISARRLIRIAIILKPATLLKFHKALVNRKYRLLFSNKSSRKPGPKGPDEKIIHLILEMKQRNPSYGYRRIAMQIATYVPTSHPFIERLIGSVRREILDKTVYWNACDLQNKLELFQNYYNEERGHHGIDGITPLKKADEPSSTVISIDNYRWKKHCQGLFELPIAA